MSAELLQPEVRWAQRKDILYVKIDVSGIEGKPSIQLKPEGFEFKATGEEGSYGVSVNFFDEIVPEESEYHVAPRYYEMILKKKNTDADYWPCLTKEKLKTWWLKVDWSRWVDEDEEAEKENLKLGGAGQSFNLDDMDANWDDEEVEDEEDDLPPLE
eukprot:CAMPEP_0174249122 /NCGR_PEP_ID=MMETSP0417-20130205/43420_1 /TAXON_ID=242541 /ORGANISM="Mayorella sp, Strain BSH-02190019" /LENGTH=156 /DNA_ID=CAMNT_0015328991 /DNA_START=28 /DNA_END=498 /DNA_ORIENTATION=+